MGCGFSHQRGSNPKSNYRLYGEILNCTLGRVSGILGFNRCDFECIYVIGDESIYKIKF